MTAPKQIIYLPNIETYNLWAPTYDTDGNILQAIDDHQLRQHLLLSTLSSLLSTSPNTLTITDLGAGTGRATLALLSTLSTLLLQLPLSRPLSLHISLLDASPSMLSLARTKISAFTTSIPTLPNLELTTTYHVHDIALPLPKGIPKANLLLSTLVLEHLPLSSFFATLVEALKPDGMGVVTNMHSHMGATAVNAAWAAEESEQERSRAATATGAGFVDEQGRKVRAEVDFRHGEGEVESVARGKGLTVGERGEVVVTEGMLGEDDGEGKGRIEGQGEGIRLGLRGRKWVGTKVWVGWVLRRGSEC
ncbi:hypothetical protein B9Z65_6925 [Elsinoe australis]|uniref:Uncharacterized protein n=1 Tax=Elsinoe australis TaxID=40998 RepID=A0A2P7Z445_9PEZI|nr:hypothetical protein B9Z65_6925 [Elsinoe australis]